jgi:hypothetical protein
MAGAALAGGVAAAGGVVVVGWPAAGAGVPANARPGMATAIRDPMRTFSARGPSFMGGDDARRLGARSTQPQKLRRFVAVSAAGVARFRWRRDVTSP